MNIKIAHIGDIQINGGHNYSDRISEYRVVLDNTAKDIIAREIDIVVIAGDVFERYQTTENERTLYSTFIHQLLNGLSKLHIIAIDGNHDVRKRNFLYFDGNNESKNIHVLEEIHRTINSKRYHYSTGARLLRLNEFPGLIFSCWSELAKFEAGYGKRSPYETLDLSKIDEIKQSAILIDVYHGTIAGAKDMGNDFDLPPDNDLLHGHICMAGHIHKYQVIDTKVYSSSLVQRSFNEGIRYIVGVEQSEGFEHDGTMNVYDYSQEHGYVLWNIDTESRKIKHDFVPMLQPVLNVTLELTRLAKQEHIVKVLSKYAKKSVNLKLVLDSTDASVLSYLYTYCANNKNFKIKKVENAHQRQMLAEIENIDNVKQVDLTVESFIEISKPILKPMIDKSFLANDELKKRAYEHAIRILQQELKYHLNPENRNEIRLISANISNFRTIHKAFVDFEETGLKALRGQNGHGKTTIYEAINFALTGQHNETFKGNAKKQYHIRLFNDKVFGDNFVKIIINLIINGQNYEVHTVLERILGIDATIDNWKEHVSKVVKTVEIFENKQRILSGPEAETWLFHMFGEYSDFAVLHSISQNTLELIKYMTNENLAKFVLQRLGYSVLGKLEYYFVGRKNTEHEDFPKPSNLTATEIITANQTLFTNIQNLETEHKNYSDLLSKTKQDIQDYDTKKQSLQDKRKHVPIDLIAKWQKTINDYPGSIDTISETLAEASANTKEYTNRYKDMKDKYDAYFKAKGILDSTADRYSKRLSEIVNYAAESMQKQYNEVDADYKNIDTQITERSEQESEVKIEMNRLESSIASITSILSVKEEELESVTQLIKDLNDNKCSKCGTSLLGKNIDQSKQLSFEQSRYDKLKPYVLENQRKLAEYKKLYLELQNRPINVISLEDLIESRTALNNERTAISEKIAKLSTTDYQSKLMIANESELYEEYMAAKTAMLNEDSSIDITKMFEKLNDFVRTENSIQEVIDAIGYIKEYELILKENEALEVSINELSIKITEANGYINDYVKFITNIENDVKHTKKTIEQNDKILEDIIEWEVRRVALDSYHKLITGGLPRYLYRNACNLINTYISKQKLPTKIQPFLSEVEYGALLLRDRTSLGGTVYRPIQDASGMELTICGLVLCLSMHDANQATNFRFVMLDELSGKLSTGTKEDPTNYLEVFRDIIDYASKNAMITVIDHRLPNDIFDSIVEIVKSEDDNLSITDNVTSDIVEETE